MLFIDVLTSLVILHLGSLGVYQEAVYFYCCVIISAFPVGCDLRMQLVDQPAQMGLLPLGAQSPEHTL